MSRSTKRKLLPKIKSLIKANDVNGMGSAASMFVLMMFEQSPGKSWTEAELMALCEEGLRDSPAEADKHRTVDDVIMILSTTALMLAELREDPKRVWKEEELLELEASMNKFYVDTQPPLAEVIEALVCTGLIPPGRH
jgi:hypothetical protein